jgi:hypothetical protein
MLRLILVVIACVLSRPALAQAVYKCNVDGKVAYGDRPCASGNSVALSVAAPPQEEVARAHEAAQRDRQALMQIETLREREDHQRMRDQRQAQREQAYIQRAAAEQRRKCDKLRLRQKWTEEDIARTTSGPSRDAARRNARRQAEELATECPA